MPHCARSKVYGYELARSRVVDLVTHVSDALFPVLARPLAPASDHGLPGLFVEAGLGVGLLSERLLAAAAAAALGLLELSAEVGSGPELLSELFLVAAVLAAPALPGLFAGAGLGVGSLPARPLAAAAAVTAGAALGPPDLAVEAGFGLVLISEPLRFPFAAAVSVGRLERPAGSAAH